MSAKRVWSYFILSKSFCEDGKFELSANTIMNLDFRVRFETIVFEIFPCMLMCIVELEIWLQNFRVVLKISSAKTRDNYTETPKPCLYYCPSFCA